MDGGEDESPSPGGSSGVVAWFTVIEKPGSDTTLTSSETEITISVWVPTASSSGTPCSVPLDSSKSAQGGWFAISNVRTSPSGSSASGAKTYWVPAMTLVSGSPQIEGGEPVEEPEPGVGSLGTSSSSDSELQPKSRAVARRVAIHRK